MLGTQLNDLIKNSDVVVGTIVQILDYLQNTVHGKRYVSCRIQCTGFATRGLKDAVHGKRYMCPEECSICDFHGKMHVLQIIRVGAGKTVRVQQCVEAQVTFYLQITVHVKRQGVLYPSEARPACKRRSPGDHPRLRSQRNHESGRTGFLFRMPRELWHLQILRRFRLCSGGSAVCIIIIWGVGAIGSLLQVLQNLDFSRLVKTRPRCLPLQGTNKTSQ